MALPAPADLDFIAADREGEFGGEGGVVGRPVLTADDPQITAHAVCAGIVFFEFGDFVEDEVQSAFVLGGDTGGQRRWGEYGQHEWAAGAGLRGFGGLSAGEVPGAGGGQPGAEEVDEPAAAVHKVCHLIHGEAERGGVGGDFVSEVLQPDDLICLADGVIALVFHEVWGFGRGWRGECDGRGVAGITGLKNVGGVSPAEVGMIPGVGLAVLVHGVPVECSHGGKGVSSVGGDGLFVRGDVSPAAGNWFFWKGDGVFSKSDGAGGKQTRFAEGGDVSLPTGDESLAENDVSPSAGDLSPPAKNLSPAVGDGA